MGYDFRTLSAADFEDLTIDLISEYLEARFESFGPGPDGGIDGRHSSAGKTIILQAKHYPGSSVPKLISTMKKERTAIDKLQPDRYVLATSTSLSPGAKRKVGLAIGPSLRSDSDIFGFSDLNKLIRDYPRIERSHIKLWLSNTSVLERIVNAASKTFSEVTIQEINERVEKYAQNPSFFEAKEILDAHRVLIVSGPPGVGKTTLAEMLSYSFSSEGWQLTALRNLSDGYANFNSKEKQIFFFDDFLGKVSLDRKSLSNIDSELNRFIRKVKKTPNKRFVLTTRAYILEEARRISEYLSGSQVDVTKYVLDVGVYTRKIRARILYNHLSASEISKGSIESLVQGSSLFDIIDHKNYNPRIVEWMTDPSHFPPATSPRYAEFFLELLDNPHRLWEIAFREHISDKCRHLLYAVFFGPETGILISDLREIFHGFHKALCEKYKIPRNNKDFEDALKILEGGFVKIQRDRVAFVNPSLRDFMKSHIDTKEEFIDFALSSHKWFCSRNIWRGAQSKLDSADLVEVASAFSSFAKDYSEPASLRIRDRQSTSFFSPTLSDLDNIDIIMLLMEWWKITSDIYFLCQSLIVARQNDDGSDTLWSDRVGILDLIYEINEGQHGSSENLLELSGLLSKKIILALDRGIETEELDLVSEEFERRSESLPKSVGAAIENAIHREFSVVHQAVCDIDSESSLEEYRSFVDSLSKRANVEQYVIEDAFSMIDCRMNEISQEPDDDSPSFQQRRRTGNEDFYSNADIKNLFSSLISD